MKKKLVKSKDKCCGCGLCVVICQFKAIKMELDEEGFYYPVINEKKCIECGLCEKRCITNIN